MGYWNDDGTMKSVYTFNMTSDERHIVSIQANKLDTVASLLGETPAEVADRVRTVNVYPVVIPTENGRILISPILDAGNNIEYDD
jgi:Neuraminidase (sialidase)